MLTSGLKLLACPVRQYVCSEGQVVRTRIKIEWMVKWKRRRKTAKIALVIPEFVAFSHWCLQATVTWVILSSFKYTVRTHIHIQLHCSSTADSYTHKATNVLHGISLSSVKYVVHAFVAHTKKRLCVLCYNLWKKKTNIVCNDSFSLVVVVVSMLNVLHARYTLLDIYLYVEASQNLCNWSSSVWCQPFVRLQLYTTLYLCRWIQFVCFACINNKYLWPVCSNCWIKT